MLTLTLDISGASSTLSMSRLPPRETTIYLSVEKKSIVPKTQNIRFCIILGSAISSNLLTLCTGIGKKRLLSIRSTCSTANPLTQTKFGRVDMAARRLDNNPTSAIICPPTRPDLFNNTRHN